MIRASMTLFVTLLLAGAARADHVTFTQEPAAERAGRHVKITFAISAPTDVAVYVLDAKGRAIRHLAAGLLGDKAPAPLQPGSLKQELVWDGKDDVGRRAEGGPFFVRVAAGIKATYDGTAFGRYGNQDSCGPEIALNWFTGLGLTDRFVYVADGGNLRVVRAKLAYAADETCPIE
jgi:hypothetical protein